MFSFDIQCAPDSLGWHGCGANRVERLSTGRLSVRSVYATACTI